MPVSYVGQSRYGPQELADAFMQQYQATQERKLKERELKLKEQEVNSPINKLLKLGEVAKAMTDMGLDPRLILGTKAVDEIGLGQPQAQAGEMQPPTMTGAPIPPSISDQLPQLKATQFAPTPFGGIRPTKYERVPTATEKEQELFEKAEQEAQKEIIQGVSGEVGGRVALAKESLKNIQDIRKIIFPDGTPKSFKRGIVAAANIPGGRAPITGFFLPEQMPAGFPGATAGQKVFRKMRSAISGRLLIQTGVAARPEEVERLMQQFAPTWTSDPEAAFGALQQLEDFYNIYLNQADPERRFPKVAEKLKKATQFPTFNTEAEAEAANLPKGTIIIIGGRRARIK